MSSPIPSHNIGHTELNAQPIGDQATIAVTGMGRSGTTMVARVMQALGVPLGPDVSANFLEEAAIVRMLKAGDYDGFAALCAERNAAHAIWGFKCPTLRVCLDKADPIMRAPRYIITFRDMIATTGRNRMELGIDLNKAFNDQARKQYNLMRLILDLPSPVLLISYEKALAYPAETVSMIADFCGQSVTPTQADAIGTAEIKSGDPRYFQG